jgi:HemY protein
MGRAMRAAGDPLWTADGVVSDRWLPVSPNGRLDGYEWKLPLAEIGISRPVVEFVPPPEPAIAPPEIKPVAEKPVRKSAKLATKAKPVEAVIPLAHAPDDPGPDFGLDIDPVPETSSPPPRDAWQRIMQLFR